MSRAVLYFRMYFAGVPLLMIYNFCVAVLRSTGNSNRIMFISITGCVVKLAFTYLFVGVFRLGIMGVSMATIVTWVVYVALAVWSLTQKSASVRLKREHLRLDGKELSSILKVGVPTGLQMGMYAIANVVISAAVNSFGAEATTGISVANTFDGILYQITHAASFAILPYVSQNIGAHNVKRAVASVWKGIFLTVSIGAFFGALSAIFSRQLASIMSDNETVIAFARQKMIIISSTYFICGINDNICAALRGMGKAVPPTIATLVFMCGIRFIWVLSISSLLCVLVPTVKKLKKEHAAAA